MAKKKEEGSVAEAPKVEAKAEAKVEKVEAPAPVVPMVKVKNRSGVFQCINLDTVVDGVRESLTLSKNETVELSIPQANSAEVKKLLAKGTLVRR